MVWRAFPLTLLVVLAAGCGDDGPGEISFVIRSAFPGEAGSITVDNAVLSWDARAFSAVSEVGLERTWKAGDGATPPVALTLPHGYALEFVFRVHLEAPGGGDPAPLNEPLSLDWTQKLQVSEPGWHPVGESGRAPLYVAFWKEQAQPDLQPLAPAQRFTGLDGEPSVGVGVEVDPDRTIIVAFYRNDTAINVPIGANLARPSTGDLPIWVIPTFGGDSIVIDTAQFVPDDASRWTPGSGQQWTIDAGNNQPQIEFGTHACSGGAAFEAGGAVPLRTGAGYTVTIELAGRATCTDGGGGGGGTQGFVVPTPRGVSCKDVTPLWDFVAAGVDVSKGWACALDDEKSFAVYDCVANAWQATNGLPHGLAITGGPESCGFVQAQDGETALIRGFPTIEQFTYHNGSSYLSTVLLTRAVRDLAKRPDGSLRTTSTLGVFEYTLDTANDLVDSARVFFAAAAPDSFSRTLVGAFQSEESVWIACWTEGDKYVIATYDTSDPNGYTEIKTFEGTGKPLRFVTEGGMAYVSLPEDGKVVVVNFNEATPRSVGAWSATAPRDLAVIVDGDDQYVYMATEDGPRVGRYDGFNNLPMPSEAIPGTGGQQCDYIAAWKHTDGTWAVAWNSMLDTNFYSVTATEAITGSTSINWTRK